MKVFGQHPPCLHIIAVIGKCKLVRGVELVTARV